MKNTNVFRSIGEKLPLFYVKSVEALLHYIRSKSTAEVYVGRAFVYSIILSILAAFLVAVIKFSILLLIIVPISTFLITHLIAYLLLLIMVDDRTKELEKNFPDALSLISANLRAGMIVNKAIWAAARPEFGPLEEELKDVGKDVLGGVPITEALINMGKRVNSEMIRQTMKLITEGIKSGGKLESLLSSIANDMRSMEMLREEVKANLAMYSLFIIFAAMIAGPTIYGISSKFVETTLKIQRPTVPEFVQQPVTLPLTLKVGSINSINITQSQINFFYYTIVIVIAFFSSLIYGILLSGRMKRGLRFTPIFIIGSILFFFLSKFVINLFFSL